MKNEKPDFRKKPDSHCLLMGLDGVTYQASLGDLSVAGALITLSDNAPNSLHVGDMCGLMLSSRPALSSSKYTGRIVSLDSDSVGISFNHQEHQHRKHKYAPDAKIV